MKTTELKTEMRAHVVGPCDHQEQYRCAEGLIQIYENVDYDPQISANAFPLWVFMSGPQQWCPSHPRWDKPTISFADFKAKYLQP
jgi:hypothetical protein